MSLGLTSLLVFHELMTLEQSLSIFDFLFSDNNFFLEVLSSLSGCVDSSHSQEEQNAEGDTSTDNQS